MIRQEELAIEDCMRIGLLTHLPRNNHQNPVTSQKRYQTSFNFINQNSHQVDPKLVRKTSKPSVFASY